MPLNMQNTNVIQVLKQIVPWSMLAENINSALITRVSEFVAG